MTSKPELLSEIRYAERLCLRTARMYRRLQTVGTFATVLGGSATLAALAPAVPGLVSLAGSAVFVMFGAALLAVRPADKAAANEADARRYAALRTSAHQTNTEDLQVALAKAHESGAPEVETLRDVAYNDVCREVGRPDAEVPLTAMQRILAAVA